MGERGEEEEREREAGGRQGGRIGRAQPEGDAATVEGREGGEGERHGATDAVERAGRATAPTRAATSTTAARRAERRAFDRAPASAPRSAFRTGAPTARPLAAAPGKWTGLGPVTPNVTGKASQFWDPVTTGRARRRRSRAGSPRSPSTPRPLPVHCRTVGGRGGRRDLAHERRPGHEAAVDRPPPDDLPTNAFGSLIFDAAHDTLYAGSGEPNGSGDSEAGLGLFKSTDGGASWSLVPGSAAVAINRSIGSIAIEPGTPDTIYIGTGARAARVRRPSTAGGGRRRTPRRWASTSRPTVARPSPSKQDLSDQDAGRTRTDPATGQRLVPGRVHQAAARPERTRHRLRRRASATACGARPDAGPTWTQIFHTINQNDFSDPNAPVGDTFGDRTEFDVVDLGADDARLPGRRVGRLRDRRRRRDAGAAACSARDDVAADRRASPNGDYDNAGLDRALERHERRRTASLAYYYCQNGQCGYDRLCASARRIGHPDDGVARRLDELRRAARATAGEPPRSNGRAVIRSTNAGGTAATTTWADMSAGLQRRTTTGTSRTASTPTSTRSAFSDRRRRSPSSAPDGGVVRVDVSRTRSTSRAPCDSRRYVYDDDDGPEPLTPADLLDCRELLLDAIPDDDRPRSTTGCDDLQFQSLSFNPRTREHELLGGTQDNGTWWLHAARAGLVRDGRWRRRPVRASTPANPQIRYHNYYDATPEVNFHGNDPDTWLAIYDPLQTDGGGAVVLHAVHRRPGDGRAERSSASSTCGGRRTTAARAGPDRDGILQRVGPRSGPRAVR